MGWNKPKNFWQWLALLSPGAVSVAFTAIDSLEQKADGLAMIGFPVAFLMCIVLAILMARGAEGPGAKAGLALLFIFLLMIVNFSIAAGGCALLPVPFDMK